MLSKKFLSIMTAAFLFVGISGKASIKSVSLAANKSVEISSDSRLGGPVDLGIANEEKIIEMLKKEGKIPKDSSYAQAEKIYLNYMQNAAKENQKLQLSKLNRDLKAKQNQKVQAYNLNQSKFLTDTSVKKVNVLVLLVDYSDYKHNNIQPDETDMYYSDYTRDHFQNMLFGDDGYTGPNGENLISMKQYYAQQSGGSLDIEGTVAGWYTLPHTAASYGGNNSSGDDVNPRQAIKDALNLAVANGVNLSDFDKEDQYDLDKDGNYNEPDGIIDYLMVLHAGVGEEAGGGSLGSSAIWSHSWDLGELYKIPESSADVNYWDGQMTALNYTIEPEDGATGVFAHEFGHNLGLPDEYDTAYSSAAGEPIWYWSIMSSGSWGGTIPGAEPTGFSPYAKQIFQALYGGNWQKQTTINIKKLTDEGVSITLKQADEQGQVIRINLPEKANVITTPTSGSYAYWGGKGNDGTALKTDMTAAVDLTGKSSASLNFKTWYDIEEGWDFASIQVREAGATEWTAIPGNITTTEGVEGRDVIVANGITGASGGWVNGIFDLSAFAGKKIELKFQYETDKYSFGAGFFVDDINVTSGNNVILSDNAERKSSFTLNGFAKSTGTVYAPHYYLVEWRNQHGVDKSLAHISLLGQNLSYEPGMVVWYADEYYTDNWTGVHPGEGFLGIVDADQHSVIWDYVAKSKVSYASGKYQMHDSAFSNNPEAAININTDKELHRSPVDNYRAAEPTFSDSTDYTNSQIPALAPLGINLPHYGLNIKVINQADDNSYATLLINRTNK